MLKFFTLYPAVSEKGNSAWIFPPSPEALSFLRMDDRSGLLLYQSSPQRCEMFHEGLGDFFISIQKN